MQRADALLDQALQLPPADAQTFLAAACGDDAALHARLVRLLQLARSDAIDDTLGHLLGGATALALSSIAPASPPRVGAWRLGESLGSGGMAQVFRAERDDGTVAQQAAVKILWPHQLRPDYVERFAREREILAALDDPRIARYLDGGMADDGRPWFAIELVDGVPLDHHLQRGDLDLASRLDLFAQIAGAVASAHRQMVVHRDLKPANVLVRADGTPRLLDFGIAVLQSDSDALTREYGRLLTPEFASPEQLAGARVDARSDIYQLGTLLYLLLAGSHPRPRTAQGAADEPQPPSARVRDIAGWPVRARALRGDLDAVVLKAIDRLPQARYASVDALLDDLQRARDGRPVLARDHGRWRRGAKWLRRHWLPASAAALALLALLAFAVQSALHAAAMAREARFNRDAAGFIENVLLHAGPSQALSEDVLANAAQRADVDLADQPLLRARMLDLLARLRMSRGEIGAGVALARGALDAARAAGDATRIRDASLTLAELRNYDGDLDAAEPLLRAVLAADAAAGRGEDGDTLLLLADVLHSRGAWREALPIAERAAQRSPARATAHCIHAMVLRDLGAFDAARAAIRRGIAQEEAHTTPAPASIAACHDGLGQLELAAGDIPAARAALERSLALRADDLGPGWSGLVWSHHWLALVHQAEGDLDGADALLTRAVAQYREHFSANSHLLGYALSDLGWLRRAQGRDADARMAFEAALGPLQRVGGGTHPRLAEPLLGLALLDATRNRATARVQAQRAYAVRQAALPDGHPARVRACLVLQRLDGLCAEPGELHSPDALEWRRMQPLP